MTRSLKHLPVKQWPARDRSLFERAFRSATDPFDDDAGPGGHLRPRSQGAIVFAYRRWLGWLTVDEPTALMLDPPDRVTRERIRSYALALATTMGPVSVAIHIGRLYDAIRYMTPERDWTWLKDIKTRLTGNARPATRDDALEWFEECRPVLERDGADIDKLKREAHDAPTAKSLMRRFAKFCDET